MLLFEGYKRRTKHAHTRNTDGIEVTYWVKSASSSFVVWLLFFCAGSWVGAMLDNLSPLSGMPRHKDEWGEAKKVTSANERVRKSMCILLQIWYCHNKIILLRILGTKSRSKTYMPSNQCRKSGLALWLQDLNYCSFHRHHTKNREASQIKRIEICIHQIYMYMYTCPLLST